jgi:hypothetical protein
MLAGRAEYLAKFPEKKRNATKFTMYQDEWPICSTWVYLLDQLVNPMNPYRR